MKLFNNNNMDVIQDCQRQLSCQVIFGLNVLTHLKKFAESSNSFCNITAYVG